MVFLTIILFSFNQLTIESSNTLRQKARHKAVYKNDIIFVSKYAVIYGKICIGNSLKENTPSY